MKKIVPIALIAAVIVGGVVYGLFSQNNNAEELVTQQDTSTASDETDQTSTPTEPAPVTESAELAAVGGYTGSGRATRTTEGAYVHTVTAQLAAPQVGKFYEGWIVIDANDFISTGKMTQETQGEWSLTYTSDEDLSAYKTVVITEETEANGLDNVPEAHVLEGSF